MCVCVSVCTFTILKPNYLHIISITIYLFKRKKRTHFGELNLTCSKLILLGLKRIEWLEMKKEDTFFSHNLCRSLNILHFK